jgi:hypothetical protein
MKPTRSGVIGRMGMVCILSIVWAKVPDDIHWTPNKGLPAVWMETQAVPPPCIGAFRPGSPNGKQRHPTGIELTKDLAESAEHWVKEEVNPNDRFLVGSIINAIVFMADPAERARRHDEIFYFESVTLLLNEPLVEETAQLGFKRWPALLAEWYLSKLYEVRDFPLLLRLATAISNVLLMGLPDASNHKQEVSDKLLYWMTRAYFQYRKSWSNALPRAYAAAASYSA